MPTGGSRTDAICIKILALYIVFILLHVLHTTPSAMWRGEFTLSVIFLATSVRDIVPIVCARFPDERRHTPNRQARNYVPTDGRTVNKRHGMPVRFDRYGAEEFPWRPNYRGAETGKGNGVRNGWKSRRKHRQIRHTRGRLAESTSLVATINSLQRPVTVRVSTSTNRKIDGRVEEVSRGTVKTS